MLSRARVRAKATVERHARRLGTGGMKDKKAKMGGRGNDGKLRKVEAFAKANRLSFRLCMLGAEGKHSPSLMQASSAKCRRHRF